MEESKTMTKHKTIGILGGMGAEATVDLYMGIWKYYQNNFGAKYDIDFPPMIIYSIPIPDVVESLENEQVTLEMLQNTAKNLENNGCDFIVIACNTVQFLLENIRQAVNIPIIGIAEVNAKHLKTKGIKKVGILATEVAIEKQVYDGAMTNIGISLIKPTAEDQEIVTEVIMTQLAGKTTRSETNKLANIAEHLKFQGAEAILLACTDLPLVINQKDTDVPLINCTETYVNEAAKLAIL
ncbi:hypothetical protein COZ41_00600 [Candidatus Shapirobacteria bacterium CG_4_10_14_3_um_filter_35_13]|uniref:Aspartate racemase n=1 Tax=Candidatus Shapirobacteria bacterium CG_4_10_14_3_um_filter_35_13 TaxID=1974873 RepID=A0A2M7LJM3_9BACT|nr:MAG: hypothetical protein COZ41_00600 [Candidatus Shapirobacteria bacterium CG_4_10_14_3_um_filter_35_13]